MTTTIYHNPNCGTSRNTLAMIRASDVEPVVVNYIETGWTRGLLETLIAATGLAPRDLLRTSNTPAEELGLTDPSVGDADILAAMVAHPILVNRPIVVTPRGARLCRPSEQVYDLLDAPPAEFIKEDGEVIRR
jgi:arsenate reductase (glutaredoxin)